MGRGGDEEVAATCRQEGLQGTSQLQDSGQWEWCEVVGSNVGGQCEWWEVTGLEVNGQWEWCLKALLKTFL